MTRDRTKVVERDGALRMSCCRAGRDARVAKESERLAAAGEVHAAAAGIESVRRRRALRVVIG